MRGKVTLPPPPPQGLPPGPESRASRLKAGGRACREDAQKPPGGARARPNSRQPPPPPNPPRTHLVCRAAQLLNTQQPLGKPGGGGGGRSGRRAVGGGSGDGHGRCENLNPGNGHLMGMRQAQRTPAAQQDVQLQLRTAPGPRGQLVAPTPNEAPARVCVRCGQTPLDSSPKERQTASAASACLKGPPPPFLPSPPLPPAHLPAEVLRLQRSTSAASS